MRVINLPSFLSLEGEGQGEGDQSSLHATSPGIPIHRAKVSRTAGWISPVVLDGGRVVGVWSYKLANQRLAIDITPFGSLTPRVVKEARARAEAIAGALGARLQRVSVV